MGGPKKLRPVCNVPDRPTSVWSEMERTTSKPHRTKKANDSQRSLADALGAVSPGEQRSRCLFSSAKRPVDNGLRVRLSGGAL